MRYFEDYEQGDKVITRRRTITETDIVNFCMFSGDWYPLHSDMEFARQSIFGERIAHGMLVMSVATGLIPLYEMAIIAFYGMDTVRFIHPTKIGNTLHMEMEVIEKKEKKQGGIVTFDCEVMDETRESKVKFIMKAFMGLREKTS